MLNGDGQRRAIAVPVNDNWRDWVRRYANDLPSLDGTTIDTSRCMLVMDLSTLLGESGPGPTPAGKVMIVDAQGNPITPDNRFPVDVPSGRPVTISGPDPLPVTLPGTQPVVVSPNPLPVTLPRTQPVVVTPNPLPVQATIAGRGTAAGTPLFVQVTNPTPATQPKGYRARWLRTFVTTGQGTTRIQQFAARIEIDAAGPVKRNCSLYAKVSYQNQSVSSANPGDLLIAGANDVNPPTNWMANNPPHPNVPYGGSGSDETADLTLAFTSQNTAQYYVPSLVYDTLPGGYNIRQREDEWGPFDMANIPADGDLCIQIPLKGNANRLTMVTTITIDYEV